MYDMPMLQSAAELSAYASATDDDMIEYTNLLRNGKHTWGYFNGLRALRPCAPHILKFLDSLYKEKDMDDMVSKTAIGVLGYLADTLGSNPAVCFKRRLSK